MAKPTKAAAKTAKTVTTARSTKSAARRKRPAPILQVKGLTHRYDDRVILDDVSFALRPGDALALAGRNGAGKTTLLRLVGGAEPVREGTVTLSGRKLEETSAFVRERLAVLLDDIDFFADLTVEEHLDLIARAHGEVDADDMVDGVLHDVGLWEAADRLPGTLSSGQRRRLALATVFVRPRTLLVLDEPEQRLDTAGLRWLGEKLRSEREAGAAVVFATHEPSLIDAVGADVLALSDDPNDAYDSQDLSDEADDSDDGDDAHDGEDA